MAFTCPDCLFTSHHPEDERNLYCGRCHAFQDENLDPSPWEMALITAVRNPLVTAPCEVDRVIFCDLSRHPLYYAQASAFVRKLQAARHLSERERALIAYASTSLEPFNAVNATNG